MMTSVVHPFIYEINTWPWLDALGSVAGRRIDLSTVPGQAWDDLAGLGFDAVWLMGVWQRSPAGVEIALANPDLVASFAAALPDFTPGDVAGSPYCVRDYVVDDHLGGREGLAHARRELADRGMGLIVDFVPNHVAPDHPWVAERPELFVQGTDDDLAADPASWLRAGDHVLARGRDPYFPAWPDVVQLDAFAPALRSAVVETLGRIAEQCDGTRCDMAMLMMNDVFERTWGARAGQRPTTDYWDEVIAAVRRDHPDFLFLAEAYWDLEWALQQQGFDHSYDKRLYDRLAHEDAEQVRLHLEADPDYQARLVRFVENHDEPRAAATFPPGRLQAATVATLTQTGARLVHHGQLTGERVHLPVFLGRSAPPCPDPEVEDFHRSLLAALTDPTFREGEWRLCGVSGWAGNETWRNLVAWSWQGEHRWLVVVNLSEATATGHVGTGWTDLRGQACRLVDPTADVTFDRTGDDVADGLFVELDAWHWHLLRVEPIPAGEPASEPGASDPASESAGEPEPAQ